jgi:two-component system sensor histidine kinase HydH
VGKLAAGLAHEIRNPLHAIQLNLHSFRRVHEQKAELPPDEITKMLEESSREIDRIEQLMQQLIDFATPDEPRDQLIDLTSEIQDIVEFIRQEILDTKIEIQARLPRGPVWARMDRGRLRQIMLNLLQNAQQAMEEGGKIEVGLTRRRALIEITVADSGPGIREEDRQRIFEPFFSTKLEGTGLGLALVKRFIDEVDGQIHCDANSDGGVTFRIELPEASSPLRI